MSKSWDAGSSRAWRKLRLRILARDKYQCQLRQACCTGHATHVHHLQGKQAGDDPTQLVAACQACNYYVGDPSRYNPPARPATRW